MGARIVLEKPDDELRPVGAAIVLKAGLSQSPRWRGRNPSGEQRRTENRDLPTIHVSPPENSSIDETRARDMPSRHFSTVRDCKPPKKISRKLQETPRKIRCQKPLPAISALPAPAISAI